MLQSTRNLKKWIHFRQFETIVYLYHFRLDFKFSFHYDFHAIYDAFLGLRESRQNTDGKKSRGDKRQPYKIPKI